MVSETLNHMLRAFAFVLAAGDQVISGLLHSCLQQAIKLFQLLGSRLAFNNNWSSLGGLRTGAQEAMKSLGREGTER
ncbi:hypothetical protein C5167_014492 [Papaver somniferum]|uniref:Uncharacterized protein n=1 Tax=Papaver somniferum TaxID=3469 RepID=A0A4Y7J7M5_PAPSO|nr:hypothetical protein C5167_014492 [Papaver somniferum]